MILNNNRWILLIIIIVLLLSTGTGCWNRREIETLNFVMGSGIDYDEESKLYRLTVQVAKAPALAKKSQEKTAFNVFTGEGRTFFDAARNVTHKSPQKLFWSHNQVFIIGESLARKGIRHILDFAVRDAELRRTFWVLISKGPAEEIIQLDTKLNKIPVMGLRDLIKTSSRGTSTVKTATINDLMFDLSSFGKGVTTTAVSITQKDDHPNYYLSGSAAFHKDQLKTFLTAKETRGLLWIQEQVKSTLIVLTSPKSGGKVVLEVFAAKSDLKSKIKDNKISINAEVKIEGNLAEQSDRLFYTTPAGFKYLEQESNKLIKKEVTQTFNKIQKLNVDLMGLSQVVYREHPKEWAKIKKDWFNKYYPELEFKVKVDTSLRRPGMISRPTTFEGEK